jgi:hypothetical protein
MDKKGEAENALLGRSVRARTVAVGGLLTAVLVDCGWYVFCAKTAGSSATRGSSS